MSTTRRRLIKYAGLAAAPLPAAADKTVDPEALVALFAKRQTVRRYKSDPVPKEHIRLILDAARRGPTCMNQQAWKFLVIQDPAKIEAMRKLTFERLEKRFAEFAAQQKDMKPEELQSRKERAQRFAGGYFTAPAYVVILVDTEAPCAGYLVHDGPIAATCLMLAARAFGYGTAYLTDGIPDEVTREALAIPARYRRVCITPIGVPDGWPEPQKKRRLEEMVVWETLEGHPPLEPLPYNP